MANQEPEHIQVQHVLIAFKDSIPGQPISRSQVEAEKLAYEVLEQARAGADFDELVRTYTDDSPPGIYAMSNRGVRPVGDEFERNGMVPAFGDVGFPLQVGEIGIADYNRQTSPYGWHIIKRIK